MIRLALVSGTPDLAACGTLVVGLHAGERPPKGEAGWVDWRSGGAVSRAILAGRIDGTSGSTVLTPAIKLPCTRVLVVGLGNPADFKGRALGEAIDLALAKLFGLQEQDFAVALPGTKPWPAPRDAAEVVGERLLGALAAAARQVRVTLLGPEELLREVREWVLAAGHAVRTHVVLEEPGGPPEGDERRDA